MTSILHRLWTYAYLAQLFDGILTDLPEPPDATEGSPAVFTAATAIRVAVAAASTDDVLTDHVRLFVNAREGVVAPPYASWYLDGQLLGPSAQWVEETYAEQGLRRSPEAGEPSDYIGAELEFMQFLTRHELAARTTGDVDSLRVVLLRERKFVVSHVARWLPAFIAQIRAAEPGPVFAAAIDLLKAVLDDDVNRLQNEWQQVDCQRAKRMKPMVSGGRHGRPRNETDCCRYSGGGGRP